MNNVERIKALKDALKQRILVLDGAMGTAIQNLDLKPEDFGGEALDGCNENLNLTRPDCIQQIHESHIEAGADIIETNTFGGTPLVLAEYDLQDKTRDINLAAARAARAAADKQWDQNQRLVWVAGSIGPTTKAISVTGGVTFEELVTHFYEQAKALHEGDVDYFLIETCQDTRNIKAALLGIEKLFEEGAAKLPIAISGTIEPMGTMLAGQSVESLLTSVEHVDLLYIGLNCATGPEFMTDHIRSLAQLSKFPIACVPNAGLPDEDGLYIETPKIVANVVSRFLDESWINLIGGCCGTTPEHTKALADLVRNRTPRALRDQSRSSLSGVDYLEVTDELRPVIVGERTNVIGSRKFKRLIREKKWEEASEVGRAQVKAGAQIVDICLADPDGDELEDMRSFLEAAIQKIRVPLMIDSTDDKVVEMALTYSQGKAIINSINLEDGEERFEAIAPLVRKFGAAVVVGTIDEDPKQGMGVTKERKLEIAQRSHYLLTEKFGIPEEDIYWDPLVFPCATGDEQYIGSAPETIEGIRLIKEQYPKTKTILGISNVSFGLPPAGREVLNSVFLYHCVQAGLDLAIVNSQKLERYASIPDEEKELADNLLFNRGDDPIGAFANHFRERKVVSKDERSKLPLHQRLGNYIIEGTKEGLVPDLDIALKDMKPLDIINGPLMSGMDEVGRLFNDNKLIVAEVLQSAEAMKAAVAHLEPFMEKSDSSQRGTVILATVKGDVHDIGKNLVDIIFSNNGFKVVNLGIKIPPEQLIEAVREHNPSIVGLSGLLVKSCQQMVLTAEDFSKAGIKVPIMVGGAALSRNFTYKRIAPAYNEFVTYAQDAMSGLGLAKQIVNTDEFEKLKTNIDKEKAQIQAGDVEANAPKKLEETSVRSTQVDILSDIPQPPDFERHIIKQESIERIWKFINPLMLYGRHLGVKGKSAKLLGLLDTHSEGSSGFDMIWKQLEKENPKALEIWTEVQAVKKLYQRSEQMLPACVYQFVRVRSEGNKIHLYTGHNGSSRIIETFQFPRQRRENGLCLADYISPGSEDSGEMHATDNMAFFATTVGRGVRSEAEKLKNKGIYLRSHILQALAIESAEGFAERIHSQIRKSWGFVDPPEMTMMERFQAKYRGRRFSFGYPACPKLDDQEKLFKLLDPGEIGVELTDGFMMDPEASVSAIVFHHPQAVYFSVGADIESENRI